MRCSGIPVESRHRKIRDKARGKQRGAPWKGEVVPRRAARYACVQGRRWTGSQFRTGRKRRWFRCPRPSLMHRINSTSYFYRERGRGYLRGQGTYGRPRRMVAAVATLSRSKYAVEGYAT